MNYLRNLQIRRADSEAQNRMNLQLFAETTGEETSQDGADANAENTGGDESEREKKPEGKLFTQEEVDRLISKRLGRMQSDIEKQLAAAKDEGRTEAEKLAKMSEEQRLEHEREKARKDAEKRDRALAEREAAIMRRELRVEAGETLVKKGLPSGLLDILDYSSADACAQSIEKVEEAFRASVQAGVDERLRESGVPTRTSKAPDYASMSDEEYYRLKFSKK